MAICYSQKDKFFFRNTIDNVCNSFPLLFERGDEGREEDSGPIRQNPIATFGIIPYILKYCEVTNETLTDVMKESINLVFYIVSYEVVKAKEQEKQLKSIKNKI